MAPHISRRIQTRLLAGLCLFLPACAKIHTVSGNRRVEPPQVCFVKSVYGHRVQQIDPIASVQEFAEENPTFRFYVVTNLPDLKVNGWTSIVTSDLPYRRMATQSRYGKFMAFKHQLIQDCGAVFYMDAALSPKGNSETWTELALQLQHDKNGIIQDRHPRGVETEQRDKLFRELLEQNEPPSNVNASMSWFSEQPDYRPDEITLYTNVFFGYDPKNELFQAAANFFWSQYSLEKGSTHDLVLWSFTLYHEGIVPMEFPKSPPLNAGSLFRTSVTWDAVQKESFHTRMATA